MRGLKEKKKAIEELLVKFEAAEIALLEKGAKTFQQLHPDIEFPKEESPHWYHPNKPEQFKTTFSFRVPDLTDDTREGYLQLFVLYKHT